MSDLPLDVLDTPDAERERRRIASDLQSLISGEVRFGRHDRLLYATDASIYQVEPVGVVVPADVEDVLAVVRYCADRGLPVLLRGGGTSLAGQCVNRAVLLDTAPHLDRVLELDPERRVARVEPGLVLDELNRRAGVHGLMFGPDVATSTHACLGGMIGNNSAGARSVLYGRTVEHLRGLDVALADGTRMRLERGAATRDETVARLTRQVADVVRPLADAIRARFPRITRRVDGYNLDLVLDQLERSTPGSFDEVNLAHLLCGSEGTLAVTLAAELALVEAPATRGLAVVAFDDLDAALAAVVPILETGPAAVELIDDMVLGLAADNDEYRRYLELLPGAPERRPDAVLYVEYFAAGDEELQTRRAELAGRFGEPTLRWYGRADEQARAWKLRKAGEPLLHGLPGRFKPLTFIEDLAVDPTRLPEFVRDFRALVGRHDRTAAYYAHASVGCLHIRPLIDVEDPAEREVMVRIAEEATDLVMQYGGSLSGEHGDGRLRSHLLERFFGREICEGFARIKSIFDPEGRLNPGMITNPASMTEHLRVQPEGEPVRVPEVRTWFRYRREGGFGHAVTLCNGAGVCRKRQGGTMCPSYRATRDERHTTRGRGNALRLAVTGQLSAGGEPAWDDPDTIETLDLCLSCKACRSECPSNVDVARLKAEYTAQRFDATGGPPWRTRLFGRVRTLNRLGAGMPGFANALASFAPTRFVAGALLGLHPKRSLPRFEPTLRRRLQGHAGNDAGPAVVLLADCFTFYGESGIGLAAVRVLESLGYRVVLPDAGCCGRSLISNGMLAEATRVCGSTAAALAEAVATHDAVAIVGLEPSCISAITDDWPDLRLEADAAVVEQLAAMTSLLEDFIETRRDEHPRRPAFAETHDGPPVMLHGHCHQKALWGLDATTTLLRRVVGARLSVLDAGCCGMAGVFGYTADRYELSMRIGELELLPAVRATPDAVVLAPGTSCRHQLRDGAGVAARHPVELLADALRR